MELRQLRYFVMLAETLNYRRASERLYISQPPLTVAIQKLEAEVGVLLFDRTTQVVRLTSAGAAALDSARKALFFADEVGRAAAAGAAGETGPLRLGFVGSATYSLLPRVLPTFRERYPQVVLHLTESAATDLLGRVQGGELDVALVRMTPQQREPAGLRFELLAEDYFMLAVPTASQLAVRRNLRLSDLQDEDFIAYSGAVGTQLRTMWTTVFQQAGFEPRIHQEATQVQTVLALVESGLGLALVPSSSATSLPQGVFLVDIVGLQEATRMGVGMVTRTNNELPVVTSFLRVARESTALRPDGPASVQSKDLSGHG